MSLADHRREIDRMLANGFSQRAVAKRFGVHESSVSHLVGRRNVRARGDEMQRLTDAFCRKVSTAVMEHIKPMVIEAVRRKLGEKSK